MRGRLLAVSLFAACYSPVTPAGGLCSPSGDCPTGQLCTGGVCELLSHAGGDPDGGLPPDATVSGPDSDGDGVPDAVDNCPMVNNPDQANEDKDKFGDACDPCPQLADNAPADGDGDHIGDACDPNPTTRDTVWVFEGFRTGVPAAWAVSVNWAAIAGMDKVRVTAAGGNNDPGEYLVLPLGSPGRTSFDNFTVTTTVAVEQTMGSADDHEAGVMVVDDNSMGKALGCILMQGASSSDRVLWLVDDNSLSKKQSYGWTNNTEYTVSLTRHGSSYTCSVVGPTGTVTATGTSSITPRTGADVNLTAFGSVAQFDSVFVAGP